MLSKITELRSNDFGGISELEHFGYGAERAYEAESISEYFPSALLVRLGGFYVEIEQSINELSNPNQYRSAFSPEDMPSNAAGGRFGEDYVSNPGKLSDSLNKFFEDAGGRKTRDSNTGFDELPLFDPSYVGVENRGYGATSNNPKVSSIDRSDISSAESNESTDYFESYDDYDFYSSSLSWSDPFNKE